MFTLYAVLTDETFIESPLRMFRAHFAFVSISHILATAARQIVVPNTCPMTHHRRFSQRKLEPAYVMGQSCSKFLVSTVGPIKTKIGSSLQENENISVIGDIA